MHIAFQVVSRHCSEILHGVQGVPSSNLGVPTNTYARSAYPLCPPLCPLSKTRGNNVTNPNTAPAQTPFIKPGYARGARELELLNACYQGLRFNNVRFFGREDFEATSECWVSVSGSSVDLCRHGFLRTEWIERMPKCGVRHLRTADGSRASVTRSKAGFRVEVSDSEQLAKVAAAVIPSLWRPANRR